MPKIKTPDEIEAAIIRGATAGAAGADDVAAWRKAAAASDAAWRKAADAAADEQKGAK